MDKEKKLTMRQKKSIATQKNILDAAIKVLHEKGHEQFNIKNICEEANISVGGFYHHYKSVEILVMKAYNVEEAMKKRLIDEPLTGNTKQRILQIFRFQVEYIERLGFDLLIQYYKGIFNHIKEEDNFYNQEFNEIIGIVTGILEDGKIKNEILSTIDCHTFAQRLVHMSRGFIFSWCSQNGNTNLMDDVGDTAALLIDSIRTNSAPF